MPNKYDFDLRDTAAVQARLRVLRQERDGLLLKNRTVKGTKQWKARFAAVTQEANDLAEAARQARWADMGLPTPVKNRA